MPICTAQQLKDITSDIFISAHCPENIAHKIAENLVETNLQGHDSHGVGMILRYIEAIQEGGLNPAGQAELMADHDIIMNFDGNHGFGQHVGTQMMTQGITRAKRTGVAVIGLANTHHLGRIGAFAEQAVAAGLVSIHFVNVHSKPVVVPWQGIKPRFGTNPFCVGIPNPSGHPVILDIATSVIASGKARVAYDEGKPLAEGIAVDPDGNPTTNPGYLVHPPFGGLLAFGEHKGSGLALICSLLGAALTGGLTERTAQPGKKMIINSMLTILLNPALLGGAESFQQEIPDLLAWTKLSGSVLIPGEHEQNIRQERLLHGIPLPDTTWQNIQKAAQLAQSLAASNS
jgi:uncharacterized oxidoreductase